MMLDRLDALAALRRHPRARREVLDAFRARQLRRLVRHAYARVPYYRALFDRHGIHPDALRSPADLATLPITRKRDLQRAATQAITSDVDPARLIGRRTSGSSGEPLTIRRTWLEERLLGAFRWRALHAMGLTATDRHADVEELQPEDPHDGQGLHRVLQALHLYRQLRVHALAPPATILRTLADYRPDVLTGYAGVMARVAEARAAAGATDAPGPRPRFVAVHSDTLTPHMRAAIARAFAAPVYRIYDSNEFNVIASECVATGTLHTCDDSVVVEVLVDGRPAAPGERGEVVMTGLHSLAMPFIRYGIGDFVIQGEARCDCGAPFATLRGVEGRMFDYFPLADGRTVHPYEIIGILGKTAPWIREFQLVQERRDLVLVRIAPATPPTSAEVADLERAVAEFLGPAVALRLELVDEIALEPNAKLRVCRSRVTSAYDAPDTTRL